MKRPAETPSGIYLERLDLFRRSPARPFAPKVGRAVLASGIAAAKRETYEPNIAVVIRTKNDQLGLGRILDNITLLGKTYSGRIDTVVVDTESTDKTIEYAKDFGATIVPLEQATFTYPRSINEGMTAVRDDTEAAFLTVGHAQPVLSNTLSASAQHFITPNVTGVYGSALPHESASFIENVTFSPFGIGTTKQIEKPAMGVMGVTGAMIRTTAWQNRPFDESFEAGGEDTHWAKQALENGEDIIFEPATSVHHSHGLGPVNSLKQWLHWNKLVQHGADTFDYDKYISRRPDMR